MQRRTLGKSGFRSIGPSASAVVGLSATVAGCRCGEGTVRSIRAAIDNGPPFDTAEVYGPSRTRELVGGGSPVRDSVVIATKFGFKIENGKQAGLDSRPRAHPGSGGGVVEAAKDRSDTRRSLSAPRRSECADRGRSRHREGVDRRRGKQSTSTLEATAP